MMRSNRGAARVSAVWLIVLVVLFLVGVAFAFIAQSDLTKERDKVAQAESAAANAVGLQETESKFARDLSLAVGWADEESANPRSDIEVMSRALDDLKATFADLGAADDTFEKALPKLVASYNARGRKIAELEGRVQALESELSAKDQTLATVTSEKDARITELAQQLADEQSNAQQRQEDLERRIAAANTSLSERDLELRTSQAEKAAQKRTMEQQLSAKDTRIDELAEATKFQLEPFNQFPDGKVIAVSGDLPIGWIDCGANQRLSRGVRFRVETGTPGVERVKAMAEVIEVKANMAEVVFFNVADKFDPVVAGDVIINPLYDPSGGRNAVLVGRFSGSFNEKDLALLLERMGIHVQPALDMTTHFLIVGAELYTDPDTNEPLEEPLQPSELATYKDAEANGVRIIPLQDVREFFKFDLSPATTGM